MAIAGKLIDIAGTAAGATQFATKLLDGVRPGTKRQITEKLINSAALPYSVPANDHLLRAFRLSWSRATSALIDQCVQAADAGANPGCPRAELDAFLSEMRGTCQTLSGEASVQIAGQKLPEIPLDKRNIPILHMFCDHIMGKGRAKERDEIFAAFRSWLTEDLNYQEPSIPPLFLNIAREANSQSSGLRSGFPYLLLDQYLHYYQNTEKYPEAAQSIALAIHKLHHEQLAAAVAQLKDAAETDQDRADFEELQITIKFGLKGIDGKLDTLIDGQQKIGEGVKTNVGMLGGDFDTASKPPLTLSPSAPNILFVGDGGSLDWWEQASRALSDARDRLVGPNECAPQHWNLDGVDEATDLAKSAIWAQFGSEAKEKHLATVLYAPNQIGRPLPRDQALFDRLHSRNLIATPNNPRGAFFQSDHQGPRDQIALLDGGAVPITVHTRIILETFLSETPLLFWGDIDPDTGDDWLPNLPRLLDLLEAHQICRAEQKSNLWAANLVRSLFDIPQTQIPNPYLRLEHYIPGDDHRYFGREQDLGDDLADFTLIDGPSGVGKSSFMNVRFADHAQNQGFDYLTLRPGDLMTAQDGPPNPLTRLCDRMVQDFELLDWTMSHPKISLISDWDLAAAAAAEWMGQALGEHRKIVIAFDQFEEIIDNIANDWNGDAWRALVQMFEHTNPDQIRGVATLESSRITAFETLYPTGRLAQAKSISLSDDPAFLEQVIRQPFALNGPPLSDDLVEKLLKQASNYGAEAGETISTLPLLTLKLYALFDHVSRRFGQSDNKLDRMQGPITEDDISMSLDIGKEIENLAQNAWNENPGDSDDLDTFLRPYIRVVPVPGQDHGRMTLETVKSRPFHAVNQRQRAFERKRLIVPAPGGHRLVHEALIRRWPMARNWFDAKRAELERHTAFLEKARHWAEIGRPAVSSTTQDNIARAVEILAHRSADWGATNRSKLSDSDNICRDFCLGHFRQSKDPRAEISGSTHASRHIHVAAAYGEIDLMTRFLDADPDARDLPRSDGRTPLMAAGFCSPEMVVLLLARNADPDLPDGFGWRAIDSAIFGDQPQVFDLLLPVTTPEQGDAPAVNPLYSAAFCNRLGWLQRLETRGWRHDFSSPANTTPLIGAVFSKDLNMLRHCLAQGDPTYRPTGDANAFDMAASLGLTRFLSEMMSHPAFKDCLNGASKAGKTPLMYAAERLAADTITWLINMDADVNARLVEKSPDPLGEQPGFTPLHFVLNRLNHQNGPAARHIVEKTRIALEALLASEQVDVTAADETGQVPWQMAQHHPSLQDMLRQHPNFDFDNLPADVETPLDKAIKDKDEAAIRQLLADEQSRPQAGRIHKNTLVAAHLCGLGFAPDVLELIQSGHVNPWPEGLDSLFNPAWQSGHAPLINHLLQTMPDILHQNAFESTLLSALIIPSGAASTRAPLPAQILSDILSRAANSDVLDTALITVAQLGSLDLSEKLIDAGADPTRADEWGRTLVDHSADSIRDAIELLQQNWTPKALMPADVRALLASGQLDEITAQITDWPDRQAIDDWGRCATDLVADQLQPQIQDLISNE